MASRLMPCVDAGFLAAAKDAGDLLGDRLGTGLWIAQQK